MSLSSWIKMWRRNKDQNQVSMSLKVTIGMFMFMMGEVQKQVEEHATHRKGRAIAISG